MEYVSVQGESVPALGFGTWQLTGDDCVRGVIDALAIGYRHIDTAQGYSNEAEVGRGIKQSRVPREEIFLVTKVSPDKFKRGDLLASADESLRKLDAGRIDLLLLHWPNPDVSLGETLGAMRELRDAGKVRHIGVSNFTPSLVEEARGHAPIFSNQVEHHPFLSQPKLVPQARELDYMLTAYSPLGRGKVNKDPTLRRIGEEHGKTPAQVTLRWLIQQEKVATIPKASTDEHRRSNFDIFDFQLSEEEMRTIGGLDREERLIDPDIAPAWER